MFALKFLPEYIFFGKAFLHDVLLKISQAKYVKNVNVVKYDYVMFFIRF